MQRLAGKQKDIRTTTHCHYDQVLHPLFCCSYQLSETEEKAEELSEEVATIIQEKCSCDFLSDYLTSPTLQCPTPNPDSSNEVVFRACVLESNGNPIAYSNVIEHLEAARGTSFSFKVKRAQMSLFCLNRGSSSFLSCRDSCSLLATMRNALLKLTLFGSQLTV